MTYTIAEVVTDWTFVAVATVIMLAFLGLLFVVVSYAVEMALWKHHKRVEQEMRRRAARQP